MTSTATSTSSTALPDLDALARAIAGPVLRPGDPAYAAEVAPFNLAHFGVLGERLGRAGATPPMTLVGVARLALPGMLVEIEATAGR